MSSEVQQFHDIFNALVQNAVYNRVTFYHQNGMNVSGIVIPKITDYYIGVNINPIQNTKTTSVMVRCLVTDSHAKVCEEWMKEYEQMSYGIFNLDLPSINITLHGLKKIDLSVQTAIPDYHISQLDFRFEICP